MNCKHGDLAVIVRTGQRTQHLLGIVIRVRSAVPVERMPSGLGPGWRYYGKRLKSSTGNPVTFVNDCCLRPIRDSDGTDETLTWAGKPKTLEAA